MLTRGVDPIWWVPDLVGNPLDDTYYLFVLSNNIPYIPQTVYHDDAGTIPWSNPIEVLANGTMPIDIYWDPDTVYRLEWRAGNTQADTLIYLVENYVPNGAGGGTTNSANSTTNQITNPQFLLVNFTGTYTSTESSILNIAPGWDIVTTGSGPGSITLTQITIDGESGDFSNPSYALKIESSGWDTVGIKQTFEGNGALWGSREDEPSGVALSISAYKFSGIASPVISGKIIYTGSSTVTTDIFDRTINSVLNEYGGAAELPVSVNTDGPDTSTTAVSFTWPSNNTVVVTSIQLIGQQGENIVEVAYQDETLERQVDQTFHYYKPQIFYEPISSYTLGWDFAFNPCQELGKTVAPIATGANSSTYIADQTILFQTVTSSIGATFSNVGVTFTAASDSSFALIQYLDATTAVELLNQRVSSMLSGFISTGTGTLTGRVSLYWTTNASLPTITTPTFDSLVTALTGNVPTVVGGWTEVPKSLSPASFTLTTTKEAFSFTGWDATEVASINTATFFAIVVSFDTLVTTKAITLEYVSLCAGDIPTRPAPLTQSQTLRALQYFYEKSYQPSALPGTVTPIGQKYAFNQTVDSGAGGTDIYWQSFAFDFDQTSRSSSPVLTFYSPVTGSSANISYGILANGTYSTLAGGSPVGTNPADGAISNWTATGLSPDRVFMKCGATSTLKIKASVSYPLGEGLILFHYTKDCRYGVV